MPSAQHRYAFTWRSWRATVVKPHTEYAGSGLFDRIRFRLLKSLYDLFFVSMVRDDSWQEPLVVSLAPKINNRILDFGPGSGLTAVALALRFPEASFIGADPDPKAVEKARQCIARHQIGNIAIIEAPRDGRLPFDAGSFDKIVCVLTLHDRLPDEKVGIVKEMMRVLRHGGTLHVADYDKPETPGEAAVLKLARYISGAAAIEPHIDGSWIKFLAEAGLIGIRRQSSHPVRVGRILVVKARKR